jgi:hypothetical protein
MSRLYLSGASDTKKRFSSTGHKSIKVSVFYGSKKKSLKAGTLKIWYKKTKPAFNWALYDNSGAKVYGACANQGA